jgi:EmrB/QacA subfamily drug resistance transporter
VPIQSMLPAPETKTRHPDAVLAVITLGYLLIALDATVMNVALPRVQAGLHFSDVGLSWVLNSYTLTFGGLLLLGSRLGDVLGRRRVMVAGIAVFTTASLLGGLAQAPGWLLAARAVQGVGAALVTPNTLALLATNFAEGAARNRALSIYSSIVGAGGSIGLVLGGLLTDLVSWRWALLINVPVGIVLIGLAPRLIASPPRHPGRFDVAGALLATAGITAIVYGFIQAAQHGWSTVDTAVPVGVGVLLLAALLLVEARAAQPVIPLRLFADRTRAGGYLNMLLIPAAMFGGFFFLTQYMQEALGYSPLRAGVAFLPLAMAMLATVRTMPRLLPRFGPRPILVTGAALILASAGWLTQLSDGSGYAAGLLGPFLLLGAGVGASVMPSNALILAGVTPADAGAASGMLQTMQWVGGSLGLAVLVSVFGSADSFVDGVARAFVASAVMAAGSLAVVLLALQPSGRDGTSSRV